MGRSLVSGGQASRSSAFLLEGLGDVQGLRKLLVFKGRRCVFGTRVSLKPSAARVSEARCELSLGMKKSSLAADL